MKCCIVILASWISICNTFTRPHCHRCQGIERHKIHLSEQLYSKKCCAPLRGKHVRNYPVTIVYGHFFLLFHSSLVKLAFANVQTFDAASVVYSANDTMINTTQFNNRFCTFHFLLASNNVMLHYFRMACARMKRL